MSDYSVLEEEVEEPEQKTGSAESHSLLQPNEGKLTEALDNGKDLDEIVGEYRPNLLLKGLVAVLKGTSTPVDHTDYSQMKNLERIARKYIVRPFTRPKDYLLTPLAGSGVRVLVGATSGDLMTEAASYLEKELGIKETPLEYTRNNLIFNLTAGLVMMLGLIGIGISIPAIIPTSAALAPILSIVNPLIYTSDMTRRLWLYSQKKPSGPWLFEAIWWAKDKVKQYAVPPLRRAYENHVTPAVERVKQFYTENLRPKLENLHYVSNPLNPLLYQPFPTEYDVSGTDGIDTASDENPDPHPT